VEDEQDAGEPTCPSRRIFSAGPLRAGVRNTDRSQERSASSMQITGFLQGALAATNAFGHPSPRSSH
jgi:hypothetical protein